MTQPLPLPIKFPCWVRAVYSWGGETKKDLGFIEGDLIECLNAGDGSWWMGRLRRDRRMVGLFPSNFVQVLDASYQDGGSRAVSPMPQRRPSANPPPAAPAKVETPKAFRKPFQSYHKGGSPNPTAAERDIISRNNSGIRISDSTASARKPFASMKRESNGSFGSRSPSPMPDQQHRQAGAEGSTNAGALRPVSRAASPNPHWKPRATSPLPPASESSYVRQTTRPSSLYEEPNNEFASPPPPAPPPHRYATSRIGTPQPPASPMMQRPRTPEQEVGTHGNGFTPSPLTNAMNDVMQCLEDIHPMRQNDEYYAASVPNTRGFNGGTDDYDRTGQYQHTPLSRTGSMNAFQPPAASGLDFSMVLPSMENDGPPLVPLKTTYALSRPHSSLAGRQDSLGSTTSKSLAHRKSAYELGRTALNRTFTTKTTATESSNVTNHTVASIASAGAFSATSAGSFYRHKEGFDSYRQRPKSAMGSWNESKAVEESFRPQTPSTGISYHTSHASQSNTNSEGAYGTWEDSIDVASITGGLTSTPRSRKSGFFKRMVDSAKTGAATARSTISAATGSRPGSPVKSKSKSDLFGASFENIPASPAKQRPQSSHGRLHSTDDGSSWVQVRRDTNRANSLSRNEREDRMERCQMLDIAVIAPIDELHQALEGEEGLDGLPITDPKDLHTCNYTLVDKNARFADNVPKFISIASLVQGYLCRPYRSDVQRLRSIFVWMAEKIIWEDDFGGDLDTRRVLSTRRGCSQEIAMLVSEMCSTVGIHSEVIEGYLKSPTEQPNATETATVKHWWNAVVVEGEWRMMDCALASPSNPRRAQFSAVSNGAAETWWFLTTPSQMCYTHIPCRFEQQHIVPSMPMDVLMALPCACPPYFRNNLSLTNYDTSLLHLDQLDVAQIQLTVPEDVECVAQVEVEGLAHDVDGDRFENGEIVRKSALCQAIWVDGFKRWTIKAVLPNDVSQGVLKVYAGKKGLMHSAKSNPHALALTLPIWHTGQNPPYDFVVRHPTPHAQRHDLYIVTPQCDKLAANNTYVFTVRQHPSSQGLSVQPTGLTSSSSLGNLIQRPSSAMSMISMSAAGSNYSGSGSGSEPSVTSSSSGDALNKKPAKLAVQSPSGRIIRLTRKSENSVGKHVDKHDGSDWETVIKVGERGLWRALVLADRSARWCVFAEWDCP